jgi:hypothetical protein
MVLLTCCHCANPAAGCPAARILISGAAAMPEAAAPGSTASRPPGSAPVMTPPRRRCPAVRCSRSRAPPRATRPASHTDPWRSRTSTRQARSRPGRQRPARHRRFDDRPVIVVGPHRLGSLARRPRFRCLPGCRHGRPAGDGRLPRPRPYVRRAVHTSAAGRFGYDWTDFRVGGLGFFELGEELPITRSPDGLLASVVVAGRGARGTECQGPTGLDAAVPRPAATGWHGPSAGQHEPAESDRLLARAFVPSRW